MANNRLYIEDTVSRERILLAKSFGGGWELYVQEDALADWLKAHREQGPDCITRDHEASFGSSNVPTTLRLVTENEE